MNTLSQRIKFAKRELTNLKTAHNRGFGLLKVYTTKYKFSDIPGANPGEWMDAIITINFSNNFAPYPFAYLIGPVNFNPDMSFLAVDIDQIQYKNSGYTAVFTGEITYVPSGGLDSMTLFSVSPPTSISIQWVT